MSTHPGASSFELIPGRWYALHVHEGFECHLSPIRVDRVEWSGKKQGRLKLGFFHLHYPEGVQDMEWRLGILQTTPAFLVARALDCPGRVVVIAERMAITGDHSEVEERNGPVWRGPGAA